MLNKKLMIALMVVFISFVNSYSKSILSIYDSHKKILSSKTMNPHYVGPIFCTGGAMSDINRVIKDMEPVKIGEFTPNSLVLIESDTTKNQVYTFEEIKSYRVTKGEKSFTILAIKSKIGKEKYDIIIGMNEGKNFDRTITIYKDGKALTLILWVDNARIIQTRGSLDI
jgi:hypothetical protein